MTPDSAAGRIRAGLTDLPDESDVVVIGLGVTGAGVALDAATRGLRVIALDAHDVAFGTSRWSSKLVHGGLRYLAKGQVGVAHESAVERGILMERIAPHLTRANPMLMPLMSSFGRGSATIARVGLIAGDLLRRGARTDTATLPPPRKISRAETLALAPGLRQAGLRGGLLSWDGQLEDDARLVTGIARTAAAYGAQVRTRARVLSATGQRVQVRDELTGEVREIRARAVINATGVWAGDLVDVKLRPSRGTHLVLRSDVLPGLRATVTVPVPGATNRFLMVLPQPDGTHYVGLTDEPVDDEAIPDVPQPTEAEIGFLLDVVSAAFERPLRRSDVAGAFAGLRPLLEAQGATADISREHAVLTSPAGVVTVVGGKLTTYRQMAEDALDATGLPGRCVTRDTPLLGAAPRPELAELEAPARLVRRFGTEAAYVLADAVATTGLTEAELLAPIAPHLPATLAELVFGITHEGAVDVDDLLERRTRIGLITEDKELARPAAERALVLTSTDTACR